MRRPEGSGGAGRRACGGVQSGSARGWRRAVAGALVTLAGCGGGRVDLPPRLDALRTISVPQARALAGRREALLLDGVGELSDACVAILAAREGGLSLGGLGALSDGAAETLARHRGWLALNGRSGLSPHAASAAAASSESDTSPPNDIGPP